MRAYSNSYIDTPDRLVKLRLCDHPACGQAGDYRAPKSREKLNDYYFFCLDHVRDYNKAWDFFSGLSPEEVEAYTRDATVWERPSWPLGVAGVNERKLRDKALRDIFGAAAVDEEAAKQTAPPMPTAEREALVALELLPPVDFRAIKAKYRALVKKHHPDLHGGASEAEEKFKNINQAFATLKKIYE